ncbi:MAG TPA: hypothetical protein PK006_07380 [Saprospiraceae bacterium]|nr:hypothetical protein [Saprospiraceae bacterium]
MKPVQANLINCFVLVFIGLWSFQSTDFLHKTAMVPVITGIVLSAFHKGMKEGNKIAGITVLVITSLLFIALFLPLKREIEAKDYLGILRVSLMLISCAYSIFVLMRNIFSAQKS